MKVFFAFILILISGIAQAQMDLLDSLFSVPISDRDTAWSDATIVASYRVVYNNPSVTDSVSRVLFNYDERMGYRDRLSQIRMVQGIAKDVLSQADSAVYFYKSGFEIAEETKDTAMMASAYNNIGLIYWNSERLDSALIYYELSEDLFAAIDRKRGLSSTLNNIGLIYQSLERYEESIKYFQRLLRIADSGDQEYFKAVGYQNMGLSYSELGYQDSAYYYFELAIPRHIATGDNFGLAKTYHNLASTFMMMDSLERSEEVFLQSIELNTQLENENALASNYLVLSSTLQKMGRLNEALEYLTKAKAIESDFDDDLLKSEVETQYNFILVERWDEEVSSELRSAFSTKDSLYKERLDGKVLRLQEEYEAEKKDQQLQIANLELKDKERSAQQRGRLIGGLVAFIMLLIAFGLLFVNYRSKLSRLKTQQRIAEERSRISRDLHDNIGAQLTAMSTRIDLLEAGDNHTPQLENIRNEAADTVSMLRDTIWAMHREEFTVAQFMARLRQYAQRVLPDDIDFELSHDTTLDKDHLNSSQALNLFRIAQEAIQNSMKHSKASKVSILLRKSSEHYEFIVSDNGRGCPSVDVVEEESYGLQNIRERSAEINGVADFETSEGNGFAVKITF